MGKEWFISRGIENLARWNLYASRNGNQIHGGIGNSDKWNLYADHKQNQLMEDIAKWIIATINPHLANRHQSPTNAPTKTFGWQTKGFCIFCNIDVQHYDVQYNDVGIKGFSGVMTG